MPENSKKRHFSGLILFLLMIVTGGVFILKTVHSGLLLKKNSLEKAIQYLKSEYVFGRIEPLSQGSYRLTLYSIEGKTVSSKVLNLPGSDLYIESRVAVVEYNDEERAFIFPARAYSDTLSEQNGIDLKPLYMRNGFPSVYTISSNDAEFDAVVREVYRQADGSLDFGNLTNEQAQAIKIKLVMDAALHRGPVLSKNRPADLLVHPDGGLEEREVH